MLKVAVKLVLLFTHGHLKARDLDHINGLIEWMAIDLLLKYDEMHWPPHRHGDVSTVPHGYRMAASRADAARTGEHLCTAPSAMARSLF